MNKGQPDRENPEWTAEDFRRAKPMKDAMPDVVEAMKRGPGRPRKANPKQHIGLRLDADVVAWLRRHKGYNALVNAALREKMNERG